MRSSAMVRRAVNTYQFVVGPETPYSLNRVGTRRPE
jgi:hypothetical protein